MKFKTLFLLFAAMAIVSCGGDKSDEPSNGSNNGGGGGKDDGSIYGSWVYVDDKVNLPKRVIIYTLKDDNTMSRAELNKTGSIPKITIYNYVFDAIDKEVAEQFMMSYWTADVQIVLEPEYTYFHRKEPGKIQYYKCNAELTEINSNGTQVDYVDVYYRFKTVENFQADENGKLVSVWSITGHNLYYGGSWGEFPIGLRCKYEATPQGLIDYYNNRTAELTPDPSEYRPYGVKDFD